jgi:endonuclease/exonuclease/phosphatase family metal-dependent hydrolase
MLKTTQRLLLLILTGANSVSVVLMVLCGWASTISPESFKIAEPFTLTFPAYLVVNLFFLVIWLIFKPRLALISAAGFLLAISSVRTYCPINFPNPHPKGCIKVTSYNALQFNTLQPGAHNKFDPTIINYVANSDADIMCIQEGEYNSLTENGKLIEDKLNTWPYRDSVHVGEGNTMDICSRYPILKKEIIINHFHHHGSVAYTLRIGRDTIIVINNHFVSNAMNPSDKAKYKEIVKNPGNDSTKLNLIHLMRKVADASVHRAVQAEMVNAYIRRHRNTPIILCGDFNDSPLSYVHHRLTSELNDAYTASGNGPGISYHESGMYFRLDNILCSRHWKAYDARVERENGASDHYPISCYLKLKK